MACFRTSEFKLSLFLFVKYFALLGLNLKVGYFFIGESGPLASSRMWSRREMPFSYSYFDSLVSGEENSDTSFYGDGEPDIL